MSGFTMPAHERQPLDGFRVVEFGTFLAAPMAGRILADNGAHVVHVRFSQPGNARQAPTWNDDAAVNATLNLGKECVEIDPRSDVGRKEAWRLVADADVVIENQPVKTMEKYGLGPDLVTAHNPRCVYVRMPAFASGDEEYADLNTFDQRYLEGVIMAAAGVFCGMGLNRVLMGVDPSFSSLPLASAYSSVFGAFSVVLGLLDREATGLGDVIEVPLAACLADSLIYNSMDFNLPERYLTLRELEVMRREKGKEANSLSYLSVKKMLDPFYHTYICKDGRPFYIVVPSHKVHQERCLRALGLWDGPIAECKDMFRIDADVYADVDDWEDGDTALFGTYPLTDATLVDRMKNLFVEAFAHRAAWEWDRIFHGLGIPGAKTQTTQEYLKDPHPLAAGVLQERFVPALGKTMRMGGPLVWLSKARVFSSEEQRQTARNRHLEKPSAVKGGWCRGIKILDLCNVIAGPLIGGILSRYGADVIKVDPTEPTYDALITVFMGIPISRGKRSLLANLKGSKGRPLLEALVRWADVVTVNQVESQLTTLGVDEASLKAINPSVVLTFFDCFGGPRMGPRSDGIGYDDLIQAYSGIMTRFGGGIETPEEHAHLGTIDVISGFSGATATVLALLKLRRTGQADVARTSLISIGTWLQTPFMYDYEGRGLFNEPTGSKTKGWHALHRWYQGRDGKSLFIAATPPNSVNSGGPNSPRSTVGTSGDAMERIGQALGGAQELATALDDRSRSAVIEKLLAGVDAAVAASALLKAGIPAMVARRMVELREQNISSERSFTLNTSLPSKTFHFCEEPDHPSGEKVTMIAPCSILSSRFSVAVPKPLPKYGMHSSEILIKELGFTEAQVSEFADSEVIGHLWSKSYLPTGNSWKKTEESREKILQEWTSPALQSARL